MDAQSASAAQTPQVPARVTGRIDESNRIVLRGHIHPLMRPEFDRGALPDSQPVTRMMLLLQRSGEQEAALRQLLEDQQNKTSPNFHAWLTPQQFGQQFGPADADVQAVTSWLQSQGFTVKGVSAGRTIIEFSGNAGLIRSALHTEIHQLVVNGEEHWANASDPQIPAALGPVVRGLYGLNNFRAKPLYHQVGVFRRGPSGELRPLFTYTDSNGTFYAVGPADFAKIYNIPSGADGSGQSIAIVGQSNINLQDVSDFRGIFGLPANQPTVILNGPDPGLAGGDEGESDLDVEWSGAVAPAATIKFVATQTTQTDGVQGIDGSALYIVDNNIAPVMSESYGSCEANLTASGNQFYNSLWQQAAAQGITVSISAGDNGSAGCDPVANPTSLQADVASQGTAVSGLASTPYNVALGGTDFDYTKPPTTYWGATNASTSQLSALGYIPETTWTSSCADQGGSACTATIINKNAGSSSTDGVDITAGSGGPSSCEASTSNGTTTTCTAGYPKPSYQQLSITGMPNDNVRDLPDVSLFASNGVNGSFYILCQSDQDPSGSTGCDLTTSSTSGNHDFIGVGGTSAAAPTFAAIMALVNQKTGQRQGNANYVLYNLAKNENYANCNSTTVAPGNGCVFFDVTKGNNSVACQGGSPNCSNASLSSGQFGILATKSGGTTPAYNTTAGYDLATGLGTINVANLLASWTSGLPSLISTTTAITTLTPPAITVDATVTISGTVAHTTGTATPTGLVSIFQGSATGPSLATFTLAAAGTYSGTTTFLPGAPQPYNVVAVYGGDANYAPSTSSPVSVTVNKQNSATTISFVTFGGTNGTTPVLNPSPITVAYGSAYILRIDVDATSPSVQPCINQTTGAQSFTCPTGQITLTDNGEPLNDYPQAQNNNATNKANLNNRGFAEDQPIQLPVGTHSIVAAYAPGDNSYNASTSSAFSVTITQASTSTTVTPSVSSITSGGTVTFTATIAAPTSNGDAPCGIPNGGTVQFLNGSTALTGNVTYTPTSGAQSSTGAAFCTAALTAAISSLPPQFAPPVRPRFPRIPVLLPSLLALVLLLFAYAQLRSGKRRIAYAFATLALCVGLSAAIAGCSGSSSNSNGGTGGGPQSRVISAKYSGDTNYSSSTGSTSVTVQ